MKELEQMTPREMYDAILADEVSFTCFEAWQEIREAREYDLGWVSGETYASHGDDS